LNGRAAKGEPPGAARVPLGLNTVPDPIAG